jgi:hypothetical protein
MADLARIRSLCAPARTKLDRRLDQTLRFTLFHRAAALVRPGGKSLLRLARNAATERLYAESRRTKERGRDDRGDRTT